MNERMILETGMLSPETPFLVWFFALAIGHFLADYPLQGEFLAIRKNHRLPPDADQGVPDFIELPNQLWVHCLTAHCMIHAGLVWIITGNVFLGLAELVLHWIIDFLKSAGLTNFHVDQFLHMACKVGYIFALPYPGA